MAVVNSCCFKCGLKAGSIIIGVIMLMFSLIFLFTTIGIVADWQTFDTEFLDHRLARYNSTTSESLREELKRLMKKFQEDIRPVWKNEFISLYCFLPWYALVNVCLILGAAKEIRSLLILWIAFTLGFLLWTFALVSVMFAYDTTPNFVGGVAVAQLSNFAVCACFILVVFSLYQEIKQKRIKVVDGGAGRGETYLEQPHT